MISIPSSTMHNCVEWSTRPCCACFPPVKQKSPPLGLIKRNNSFNICKYLVIIVLVLWLLFVMIIYSKFLCSDILIFSLVFFLLCYCYPEKNTNCKFKCAGKHRDWKSECMCVCVCVCVSMCLWVWQAGLHIIEQLQRSGFVSFI